MVAVEKEDRPPSAKSSSAGVLTTEALQNLEVIHSQKRWLKDLVTEMAELDVSSTQSPPPCAREIGVNSNASSPSQSPAFARSGSRASTANNDPTPETAISSRKLGGEPPQHHAKAISLIDNSTEQKLDIVFERWTRPNVKEASETSAGKSNRASSARVSKP
ncbi:MAG: hypothetical protein SGPRY_003238 [Prymnesium sp.]